MSTEQILALLVTERDRIERAIAALSGSKSSGKLPGASGGRIRTPEQRAAQSEKMKQYWAERKAAGATKKSRKK